MSDKRREDDNRDVFEKALDDYGPAAAAVGAGLLGRKIQGKVSDVIYRRNLKKIMAHPDWASFQSRWKRGELGGGALDRTNKRLSDAMPSGDLVPAVSTITSGLGGYVAADAALRHRKRKR